MKLNLQELAGAIGAELVGDGGLVIDSVNTLEEARPGQISFLSNPKYRDQLGDHPGLSGRRRSRRQQRARGAA